MTPFAAIASRWPTDALALLDRLWGTDATMAAIQRELRRRTGMAYSGTEIRIAASRPKPHRTTAPKTVACRHAMPEALRR